MGTMGGTVNGTRRRVLVVDDEENVAHLVSSALRFDGFETLTADSGSRALAAVAEHAPDVAFYSEDAGLVVPGTPWSLTIRANKSGVASSTMAVPVARTVPHRSG